MSSPPALGPRRFFFFPTGTCRNRSGFCEAAREKKKKVVLGVAPVRGRWVIAGRQGVCGRVVVLDAQQRRMLDEHEAGGPGLCSLATVEI